MQPHPKLPDFDTLMKLAQQDPDTFENFRNQLLADAVADCPPRHKESAHAILRRIEIARQSASTPFEALLFAARLMRESLDDLNNALYGLQNELANLDSILLIERIKGQSEGINSPPRLRKSKDSGLERKQQG